MLPNGSDVLAINVYKTAGTDVNANIIQDGRGPGVNIKIYYTTRITRWKSSNVKFPTNYTSF